MGSDRETRLIQPWRCAASGATGYLHTPTSSDARGGADGRASLLLLCLPPGPEFTRLFVALRGIAERLCGDGWCVLRLELPGCGNAAGEPADVRLADWLAAIAGGWRALDELAAGAPLIRVAVGARLSANLLAAEAGASERVCAGHAAIAPITGAGWVADLRATTGAMREGGLSTDGLAGEAWNDELIGELTSYDWSAGALDAADALLIQTTHGQRTRSADVEAGAPSNAPEFAVDGASADWVRAPLPSLSVCWTLADLPAVYLPTLGDPLCVWANDLRSAA